MRDLFITHIVKDQYLEYIENYYKSRKIMVILQKKGQTI